MLIHIFVIVVSFNIRCILMWRRTRRWTKCIGEVLIFGRFVVEQFSGSHIKGVIHILLICIMCLPYHFLFPLSLVVNKESSRFKPQDRVHTKIINKTDDLFYHLVHEISI